MTLQITLRAVPFLLAAFLLALGPLRCFGQDAPALSLPPLEGPVTPANALLIQKVVAAAALGDFASLRRQLTPQMAALLTPAVQKDLQRSAFAPRGAVLKVTLLPQSLGADGLVTLPFTVSLQKGTLNGVLGINAAGQIALLKITPDPLEAAERLAAYRTKAAVHLPFAGAWFVATGGPDPAHNRHSGSATQRYAYDFLIQRGGATHRGDGRRNTDYFAYGQPILAPVSGTVVVKVDGVPENMPGQMNSYDIAGNYLLIDDGHQEWVLLAHLQPHSSPVEVGQHVAAGQKIGSCGNSGRSSEPHLHVHMQNSADTDRAAGLPITFQQYIQDGKPVEVGQIPDAVTVQNK